MNMRITTIATLLVASTTLAYAQATPFDAQAVGAQYQNDGYTRVDIDVRQDQARVEAVKGNEEIKVIYDVKTGAEVTRWTDDSRDGNDDRSGLFVHNENGTGFTGNGQGSDDHGSNGNGGGQGSVGGKANGGQHDDGDHGSNGQHNDDGDHNRSGNGGGQNGNHDRDDD